MQPSEKGAGRVCEPPVDPLSDSEQKQQRKKKKNLSFCSFINTVIIDLLYYSYTIIDITTTSISIISI